MAEVIKIPLGSVFCVNHSQSGEMSVGAIKVAARTEFLS